MVGQQSIFEKKEVVELSSLHQTIGSGLLHSTVFFSAGRLFYMEAKMILALLWLLLTHQAKGPRDDVTWQ